MKNQYDLLNGSSVDFDEYEEIELTASEKKRMKERLDLHGSLYLRARGKVDLILPDNRAFESR